MKRIILIAVIIICISVGISATTYAQGEPEADTSADVTPAPIVENSGVSEADDNVISEELNEPRLADGVAGRGAVDAPDKYWAENGYPENISFAFEAGGEMLDDGTSVAYWEIGIVKADEASKQEIIDLLSPSCRITFRDCTFSYKQREAAYNEIYASRNDIVRDVLMVLNSELVMVEVADDFAKEYAMKYVEQYGWFVLVTNDIGGANDALTGGGLETGGVQNDASRAWLWLVCFVLLAGTVTFLFYNRGRFVPAMQTNNGNVVAGNSPVSRKQTIAAIKKNILTPSDDVYRNIIDKVDKARQ